MFFLLENLFFKAKCTSVCVCVCVFMATDQKVMLQN